MIAWRGRAPRLVHALPGIARADDLQGHRVAGSSWEGFVIEQVAALMPTDALLASRNTAGAAVQKVSRPKR